MGFSSPGGSYSPPISDGSLDMEKFIGGRLRTYKHASGRNLCGSSWLARGTAEYQRSRSNYQTGH